MLTTRLTADGRYQWYRDAWEAGRLDTEVTEFDPWELKYAVNTYRRDEDLEWALGAMHERNAAFFKKSRAEVRREWGHNTPWMVPYTWDMINKGYGNMSTALDVMAKGGFVCGGQSDFAQAAAQAHGIPAAKQGGPGHGWMAWKPAANAAWDPTGNGGYSPSNSSYRDDWYEDGSHSQARLQCYALPERRAASPWLIGCAWVGTWRRRAKAAEGVAPAWSPVTRSAPRERHGRRIPPPCAGRVCSARVRGGARWCGG